MGAEPQITDTEIIDGVRRLHANADLSVRVRKRRRLRPTAGLTGSYFERVHLEIDRRKLNAILKCGDLSYGPPLRESLFFEYLAHEVPVRAPRTYGVGRRDGDGDTWVLIESLPTGKTLVDWTPDETLEAIRNLARLHAAYMGRVPSYLPRPFSGALEATLGFVAGGAEALRRRYEEFPYFPRVIGERALDLAVELASHPEIFREAFARSPETLLHGDYHRGNLLARNGRPQILFDWQFVCAGPPAYDLAVFWLYLGVVNKRGFMGRLGLPDRAEVRERELTWQQVLDVYADSFRFLRPDVDVAAVTSCEEEALAWEIFRQVTYFACGLENFGALIRFIYRDHRTIGGWFARWIGMEEGWRLYREVFADFEARAERLLARVARHDGRTSSPA